MSTPTLYWWKRCSTCRDALAWLRSQGVEPALRDIFDEPLTESEFRQLSGGDLRTLISIRSPGFKALGRDPAALTDGEALQILQSDPRMMRRPILETDGHAIVGFARQAMAARLETLARPERP